MKLYIVSIGNEHVSWDMYDSFLVQANSTDAAIKLAIAAANEGGDEYFQNYSPVAKEVGLAIGTGPAVLMSSFNAG